nr:reverse transcriptase domain-containing protein [Tanacetum cinerariifolium]
NLDELSPPIVTMADQRTMAQLLQAPTEGYKDAIVVPAITADNFELKHDLLTLRFDESFSEAWDIFKDLLRACPHHGFSKLHQLDTFYNALNSKDQDSLNSAAGGNFLDKMPRECLAIIESKSKDMVKALLLDMKSQNQAPATVKAVEESCVTCGGAHSYRNCPATDGNVYRDNIQEFISQASAVNYNQGNTSYRPLMMSNQIRPPGYPPVPNINSSISKPVAYPVSAPRPNLRPSIPYPSRMQDQKLRDKANDQREKFFQIFKDLNFNISFADALILMPNFGPSIKSLLTKKDKLCKLARTPLNEHCSAVLLKKLPEKLGNPGKFLIPYDFFGKAECLALADLDASINLMPLSVWNKLSLPDLTHTCMTLELSDRSISRPVGVVQDVYVKVGSFHFLADFVVVDFDADPRVPLILGRYFLNTKRALIDVFKGELTLREVLGFSDVKASGNPTPYYDLIVSTTSPTLTPFRNSDFLLEEVDAFLAIDDDPTSSKVDQTYLDPEGDILLLEAFLNDDPLPPPNQGNYLPEVRKELKICEAKSDKSSIDEPPEVELKDLPPHLEYAFLEGDGKLLVIITKDLYVEEKTALIMVLNSHKRAIAWKLSDIKGIDPEFYTHKILMEEDYEPTVQHQRRVNPKIHDVIKQEGGFTVVENEDNELIPTRLVIGWHVCIDYRENHKFTCPYGTFAYRRMPFGLCNAPGTFQSRLSHLERMLKRCEDTNLCLNLEKSHFMVKKGIVLGHKISRQGIEVDKVKVDVITKLSQPTTVKGIRSILGHASFYRCFIKDFSKIARPMTPLLEKDTSFIFSKECVKAFQTLKIKLTEAPILIAPDWDMLFELMCDASYFAIGAVLGQRQDKHFRPIHYASKSMTKAESNYTTMEKKMLAVVYAFEKFRSYLIINKSIVYTDHSALKYLFAKKDSKARLLCWVLLLQEFTFKVIDTKGAENLAADHLSRLENPHQNVLDPK